MVNILEQEARCTAMKKSEEKNFILDNLWATFLRGDTGSLDVLARTVPVSRSSG